MIGYRSKANDRYGIPKRSKNPCRGNRVLVKSIHLAWLHLFFLTRARAVTHLKGQLKMAFETDLDAKRKTRGSLPPDNLNARIGVLTRREIEARILKPLLDELGEAFGHDAILRLLGETIVKIAVQQGAELAERLGGNSFQHFAESLQYWTMDNALEIEVLEQTDQVFAFNVKRCRYAELYESLGMRDLGSTLSCARDFALINGFNSDVMLVRTQTIMEGAAYCDFRYHRIKK
jgi:hypothetical protein